VTRQKEELNKQAEIDKDIQITKAQGEAEALKIKGQSISSNPKIVELEWINKWDGKLPTYMLGNQGVMLSMPNK
jgi:regulator of protease activity HflC (stomatin/prohibitin superfamily)